MTSFQLGVRRQEAGDGARWSVDGGGEGRGQVSGGRLQESGVWSLESGDESIRENKSQLGYETCHLSPDIQPVSLRAKSTLLLTLEDLVEWHPIV